MKTVNIKGKEYIEVNERLKYFRANFKGWSLESEIHSIENGTCIIKATIKDDSQIVKATGYAYEKEGSTFINKTSYIENCETSAWGRALGNMGIGIDTSVASSEEVSNAILNQEKSTLKKPKENNTTKQGVLTPQSKSWQAVIDWAKENKISIEVVNQTYTLSKEDSDNLEKLIKAV